MKGYKTVNGYVTIAEIKARQRKIKKDRIESLKRQQIEFEKLEELKNAKYRAEKQDQKKAVENENIFNLQAKELIEYTSKTLQYKEYLIAYDIACRNKMQIESDLNNNKITINQFKKVFEIAIKFIDNLQDFLYFDDLLIA